MDRELNMSARAVRKRLREAGCEEVRQKGSHLQVKCPGGRQTTVPLHGARDIRKGTLRSMERSLQLDIDGDGRPKPNPRRNPMPLTAAQRRKIEAAELLSQTAYWKDVETAALDILRLSESPKEVQQYVRDTAHAMTTLPTLDEGRGFTRALDILQWTSHPDAAWFDRNTNKIRFEYVPAVGPPLRKTKPVPKNATSIVQLLAYFAYWSDLFTMIESKRAEGRGVFEKRGNPTDGVRTRGEHGDYEEAMKRARTKAKSTGRPYYVDWSPVAGKWVIWEWGGRDDPDPQTLFGDRYMETLVEPPRKNRGKRKKN